MMVMYSQGTNDRTEVQDADTTYLEMVKDLLKYGERRTDRTGVGTLSRFGLSYSFPLYGRQLPLIGSKKVLWDKALIELNWMLRGETNIEGLGKAANIWKPWADEDGELGPVYGHQWRRFNGVTTAEVRAGRDAGRSLFGQDQIRFIVQELRENPDSRRAFMSAWNPAQLEDMALPPCPVSYQFSLRGRHMDDLELHVYQRSADVFLGVPFDLVEFGALAHLVAADLGVYASRLIWSVGDLHLYGNHMEQAKQMVGQGAPWNNLPVLEYAPAPGSATHLDGHAHMAVDGYAHSGGLLVGAPAV